MIILNNISQSLIDLVGEDYKDKTYLLAVSGGVDSMVMLDVFRKLELKFKVAHCNYQLRGEDSNKDAQLVADVCTQLNIELFSTAFDTNQILEEKGGSIQEVARDLRYTWFEEIMPAYGHLVTAHHLNDNIETFFINLSRGSGLKGLSGIPEKNDYLIRPFLNTSKHDFLTHAEEHDLEWREDESNKSDKYLRNIYRNQIIPAIKETKPKFDSVMTANIDRIRKSKSLLDFFIEEVKVTLVQKVGGQTKIAIDKLKKYPSKELILYEMLNQFGFNYNQAENMLNVAESGKTFLSKKFKAVIERGELILFERKAIEKTSIEFNSVEELIESDFFKSMEELHSPIQITSEKGVAYFDLEKVTFPLTLRNWQGGDSFQPLGMKGQKKVSDYLTDVKESMIEKESTLVLEDKNHIIWLVNHRVDDRVKITSQTKKVIKLVTKQ